MTKSPFSLKLDPEILEQIRIQAKKEHRSVSNLIEVAIIRYLDNKKKKKENPGE